MGTGMHRLKDEFDYVAEFMCRNGEGHRDDGECNRLMELDSRFGPNEVCRQGSRDDAALVTVLSWSSGTVLTSAL